MSSEAGAPSASTGGSDWPVELQVVGEAAFGDSDAAKSLLTKLSLTELRTFDDLIEHVSALVSDEIEGRVLAQRLDP